MSEPISPVLDLALLVFDLPIYIGDMLWRDSRGRPVNAPAAFIHPCQPTVAKQPPSGPGWAHELKHDGYRLQIMCAMAAYVCSR